MKKKTIIIISAAAAILIALIIIGTVFLKGVFKDKPTASTGSTTLTVSSVSGEKGKTVTVPVKIKGNPGIMGYLLDFKYDKSVLEYAGYDKGDFLSDYELNDTKGELKFVSVEEKDIAKDGVIINLKFKILSDTTKSKTEITLECDDNSMCNYNEETIKANVVNGTVTIK